MFKLSLVTFLVLINCAALASHNYSFSVGGVVADDVKSIEEDNTPQDESYGAGVLIGVQPLTNFSLEFGALSIKRQYDFQKQDRRLVQIVRTLHVPLTFNYSLFESLTVGVGPFASFRTGEVITQYKSENLDPQAYTSAQEKIKFGTDISLKLSVFLNKASNIFIQGRYSEFLRQQQFENINRFSALTGLEIHI